MPINRLHAFGGGLTLPAPESPSGQGLPPELQNLAQQVWSVFRQRCRIDATAQLGPHSWIENLSGDPDRVTIGARTVLRGLVRVEAGGRLSIGRFCYVGDDTLLSAQQSITVADHVLIAHECQLFDNNSHPVDWQQRRAHFAAILGQGGGPVEIRSAPVVIEEDAWLGFRSTVMKGVTIGARTILSAGAVATRSAPPDSVMAGNPAEAMPARAPAGSGPSG